MEFTFDFGAKIDVLTKGELDDSLSSLTAVWREYALGLKALRRTGVLGEATDVTGGVAAGALTGPRQGFAWMVTLVSVVATTAATVGLWLGETGLWALAPEQTLAAGGPAVFAFGAKQLILRPTDKLWVSASAGKLTRFLVAGIEAPAEQIFKLVGG